MGREERRSRRISQRQTNALAESLDHEPTDIPIPVDLERMDIHGESNNGKSFSNTSHLSKKAASTFSPSASSLSYTRLSNNNMDVVHAVRVHEGNLLDDDEKDRIRLEAQRNVQQRLQANVVEAQEYDHNNDDDNGASDSKKKRRSKLCIAIPFLLALILVLIAIVILKVKSGSSSDPTVSGAISGEQDNIDSPVKTPEPTSAPITEEEAVPAPLVFSVIPGFVCEDARQIIPNTSSLGSTENAPSELNPPPPVCGPDVAENGRGVWYKLVGRNAIVTLSTCNDETNFDTQLSIFKGSCGLELECVTSNDQYCSDKAQVSWFAESDVEYFIFLHGFRSNFGTFRLDFSSDQQDNTNCATAEIVPPSLNAMLGSTRRYNNDDDDTAPATTQTCNYINGKQNDKPGRWYKVIGTGKTMTVSTCNDKTNFKTDLSIMFDDKETCSNTDETLKCALIERLDCPAPFGSVVQFDSQQGQVYYIVVHGASSSNSGVATTASITAATLGQGTTTRSNNIKNEYTGGEFNLIVTDSYSPNGLVIDPIEECEGAEELFPDGTLEVGLVTGVSTVITNHPFQGICGDSFYDNSPSTWYLVIGTGDRMTVSTCHSATFLATQITVFGGGSCSALQCIDGSDQYCGDQSSVTWDTDSGEMYYILVHSVGLRRGGFVLHLEIE